MTSITAYSLEESNIKSPSTLSFSFSDTGTVAPEKCLFGAMLNIAAFLCKY